MENDKIDKSDEYFKSYEDLNVHSLMLNDNPRMVAYKNAIFNNKETFLNKTVMDVGAGTGILSIFCAQAGASKVYSIEASQISKIAHKIIKENNLADKIEIMSSKIEDVCPKKLGHVDIIISEWMGFYLVHEAMLDSIILARDRFLKADGLLFPCIAKLYAAPCQIPQLFHFWSDVHGVKMTHFGRELRLEKSVKPEIMLIDANDLLSEEKIVAWIDLKTVTIDDLKIIGDQDIVFPSKRDASLEGVCVWFDVEFLDGTTLSTSPFVPPTHWKQTVIVMPSNIDVNQSEPLAFKIKLTKDSLRQRSYHLQLTILDPEDTDHDLPCECYMTKCIVAREYIKNHSQEINDTF